MVLGRENLRVLTTAPTNNRMNFILTYLVLLAGTGADHRLTKWSAKACEQKLGIGRPRATLAIQELARAGLLGLAEGHTAAKPQYRLKAPSSDLDEIFLPVQIVTGFEGENPVLRRVRETGDVIALRILLAIYAEAQLDGTYGVPTENLRVDPSDTEERAMAVLDRGIYRLWSLEWPETVRANPVWVASVLNVSVPTEQMMASFWDSFNKLMKIGAVRTQNWVFDSGELDAEPMFPVDRYGLYEGRADPQIELMQAISSASYALLGEETYLYDKHECSLLVPILSHFKAPIVRGVVLPTVTPDSPGHRRSYARKMSVCTHFQDEYDSCVKAFQGGSFSQPMKSAPSWGGADVREDPF